MDNKVTYYLGAGASANALPIVNKFASRFSIFLNSLKQEDTLNEEQSAFIQDIEVSIKYEFSPDTLAKKFFHQSMVDGNGWKYDFFKNLLTAFIIFEQTLTDFDYDEFEKSNRIEAKKNIDERYDAFLATVFDKRIQDLNYYPQIDRRINFISWNYDSQLELSLNEFNIHKSLSKASEYFKESLVKLNGSAQFLSNIDEPKIDLCNYSRESLGMSTIANYVISGKSDLRFAWDKEGYGDEFTRARNIMEQTNDLVIIGYSFPYYNREVDKKILSAYEIPFSIETWEHKKIFIQDTSEESIDSIAKLLFEIIKPQRMNFKQFLNKIVKPVTNVNQFVIPFI